MFLVEKKKKEFVAVKVLRSEYYVDKFFHEKTGPSKKSQRVTLRS